MIIPLPNRLSESQFTELTGIANEFGVQLQPIVGTERTIYAIIGDESSPRLIKLIEGLPFVDRVNRVQETYKLMSKQSHLASHEIKVGKKILGRELVVIAGHCAIDVDNKSLMMESAFAIKEAGGDMIRGGVWKPRTSPYSYQGDSKGLDILLEVREKTGLPINTEVMNEEQLDICVENKVDSLQIGARNALNYKFLQEVGKKTAGTNINVMLKRSLHMGPMHEFILAAEYIVAQGNPNVILVPRGTAPGITGFRNAPDESITMLLKERTWAPVVVDPSHSVGKAVYVPNTCLASISYGADGVLVETNASPSKGLGDDPKQAITPESLAQVIIDCKVIYQQAKKYLPTI